MLEIQSSQFIAPATVNLTEIPTDLGLDTNNKQEETALDVLQKKLSKKQDAMYAHNKHAFLICLQGMDTSGKDSLIREVFKEFNPRGVVVHSFKTPNSTELEHDYLWRHYIALPEKGKIAVFNRTHYENVLVTRVHPHYILNENLPHINKVEDITPQFWEQRMQQINNFEQHLTQNGTTVLKFYLHMSKEEQRKRLLKRLEQPEDQWKFSAGDLKERERWDDYMTCYEDAITKTNTQHAPWYIIPADDKGVARYLVAKIIAEKLTSLTDIVEPTLEADVAANIPMYLAQLKE
jgi:PPK2 family polyphosphate:nucleotide phosphotransferase